MNKAKQLIEIIEKWQCDPSVHPLTCGINSEHQLLKPVFDQQFEKVQLFCVDCEWKQEVPDFIQSQISF